VTLWFKKGMPVYKQRIEGAKEKLRYCTFAFLLSEAHRIDKDVTVE
jgi:hypothetical protein